MWSVTGIQWAQALKSLRLGLFNTGFRETLKIHALLLYCESSNDFLRLTKSGATWTMDTATRTMDTASWLF